MVWDVLGVMLGFSTIMLLFSILVTTINQVLIALLDLKATHFKNGIDAFKVELEELTDDGSLSFFPDILSLKKDPTKVNSTFLGLVTRVKPEQITELPEKKLKQQLVKITNVPSDTNESARLSVNEIELVLETFKVYEQKMFETFKKTVSKYSVLFSLIIALGFQLNPFVILKQLSNDEQYREDVIKHSESLKLQSDMESFGLVKEAILEKLMTEFEKDNSTLEEVSLTDNNENDLRDELRMVLADSENQEKIVDRYDNLLVEQLEKRYDKSLKNFNKVHSDLNAFGFSWLPNKNYYTWSIDGVMNIIAAIFSALLIALGAPFWYNLIGTLSSLKDKKKTG